MTSEHNPFPASSFAKLATLEANNWWFRSRNRILIWALRKYVGTFEEYLEIGCGTGYVLEGVSKAFPQTRLHASEYFEEGLVHAEKRVPTARFQQLDATRMNDDARYDVIGAFDVIEHIEQDQRVLDNFHRALKPGGTAVISVPQHRWLWSQADVYACHKRRYTRAEMIKKIEMAGFEVAYSTSFVSLLVPLMWLSRRKATKDGNKQDYDPHQEFMIPGWMNKLLEVIMGVELSLLKLGLRLPIGGSLLVIAKKR